MDSVPPPPPSPALPPSPTPPPPSHIPSPPHPPPPPPSPLPRETPSPPSPPSPTRSTRSTTAKDDPIILLCTAEGCCKAFRAPTGPLARKALMRHLFRYQKNGAEVPQDPQVSDLTQKQIFDRAHYVAHQIEVVARNMNRMDPQYPIVPGITNYKFRYLEGEKKSILGQIQGVQ